MPRTFNVLALAAALAAPVLAGDSCWIEKDANTCVDNGYYSHGSGYYQQNCHTGFEPKEGSWPLNGDDGEDCDDFEKCLEKCDEKGSNWAVHDGAKCKVYAEGSVSSGGSYTVGKFWGKKSPCDDNKVTTTSSKDEWNTWKSTTTSSKDEWNTWKSSTTTTWSEPKPTGCEPWTEEYVCDDEKKGEYTTTMTKYNKGCPGYTETSEWEEPQKTTSSWGAWPTEDSKNGKGPKHGDKNDDKDDYEQGDKKNGDDKDVWSTWKDPKPSKTTDAWSSWPTTTDAAKWEDVEYVDGKKVVIVTWTEEYDEPCSTGWAHKTTTVYGTHCGCTETPVPEHPDYTTYTTECPESWGLGKTVTVKVPYATYTPKKVDAETTATWEEVKYTTTASWEKVKAETTATWEEVKYTTTASWEKVKAATTSSATWSSWSVDAAKCGVTTSTWTTTECGTASSTWADCSTVTKTATVTPASCYPDNGVSWAVWSTSTKPAAATGTAWSPISTWKGAATNTAVNKVMVVLAGAVAGAAFLL